MFRVIRFNVDFITLGEAWDTNGARTIETEMKQKGNRNRSETVLKQI